MWTGRDAYLVSWSVDDTTTSVAVHCHTWLSFVTACPPLLQVVGNVVQRDPIHAVNILRFAMRASEVAATVARPDLEDGSPLQLRIGVWQDTHHKACGRIRIMGCVAGLRLSGNHSGE